MTPAAAMQTPEYRALQAAEAAYTAELLRTFGPDAAEANRYGASAFFTPDRPLSIAYHAMMDAERAFRALMTA